MVAYLLRMPAGIPGDVISTTNAFVEPQEITESGLTNAPDAYGIPVVLDATTHKARKVTSGDTAANIRGFLVRPFPGYASTNALGTTTPPADGECDVLRTGRLCVRLSGTAPAAKGAPVYIWKSAATGTHIVGGIEAADPSTDGFVIAATFDGPADPDGNVVIQYNI